MLPIIAVEVTIRALRWRVLLPRDTERSIALTRIVPTLLVGYLGNATLPMRLGEPLRAYLLSKRENLDGFQVFGSVVIERVLDTAVLALFALWAAITVGAPEWLRNGAILVTVVGFGIVATLWAGIGPVEGLVARVRRRIPNGPITSVMEKAERFVQGAHAGRRPRTLALALALTSVAWVLDGAIYWLIALALGISLSPAAAFLIASVTVLGTAIPAAPGYVGTFELAAAGTATLLGVPPPAALSLAVLVHAATQIPIALGGAMSLAVMGRSLGALARDAAGPDGTAGFRTATPDR